VANVAIDVRRRDDSLGGLRRVTRRSQPRVDVDSIDLALLRRLSLDSRTSQRQLARDLGISAPTVGERISRLEKAGAIRRYSIEVDWEALGFAIPVFISVTAAQGYDVADIMERLYAIAEVEAVNVVTGSQDLLVRLRVRDHTNLRDLLQDQIWQIPGMQRTETHISVAEMPAKDYLESLLAHMASELSGTANGR
jgi:DNA-binding Lrp family transcriptional regulator